MTTNTTAISSPRKSAFGGIFAYFKRRAVYNQTFKELSALSNRELNDIGVSRGDIRFLSLEHANSVVA
jgi:uncharacterized protein YjiS (DUF1127 family)